MRLRIGEEWEQPVTVEKEAEWLAKSLIAAAVQGVTNLMRNQASLHSVEQASLLVVGLPPAKPQLIR